MEANPPETTENGDNPNQTLTTEQVTTQSPVAKTDVVVDNPNPIMTMDDVAT